jgi:hypothetical protein
VDGDRDLCGEDGLGGTWWRRLALRDGFGKIGRARGWCRFLQVRLRLGLGLVVQGRGSDGRRFDGL